MLSGAKLYEGQCGQVIGLTNMLPSWYIVRLENGQRVVAHPGHLLPIFACSRAPWRVG